MYYVNSIYLTSKHSLIMVIGVICEIWGICVHQLVKRHIHLPPHELISDNLSDRKTGLSIDRRAPTGHGRQAPLHVAVCEHMAKAVTPEQV